MFRNLGLMEIVYIVGILLFVVVLPIAIIVAAIMWIRRPRPGQEDDRAAK